MHAVVHWLRRWTIRAALVLAAIIALGWLIADAARAEPDPATMAVDSLIVTGLDVSSSMNATEIMIQVDGLIAAIQAPDVIAAVQRGPHGRIGFAVFLWADGEMPEVVPWRSIGSVEEAAAVAEEIRLAAPAAIAAAATKVGSLTDLSAAMEHAGAMLRAAPFAAETGVVNIVGNGADNVGDGPTAVRAGLIAAGVIINGVVIGGDPRVVTYFRQNVVGGPRGGFVATASKSEGLVYAFRRKFMADLAMVTP